MLNVICKKSSVGYAANTYIISSDDEYAIVDPSLPYDPSLIPGELKYIFITHAHFDHMLELTEWQNATGAAVCVSHEDAPALADSYFNCYKPFLGIDDGYHGPLTLISDGERLRLGRDELSVMICPGHTVGSAVLYSPPFAFVGDIVFEGGGYGRCDLPGGDFSALISSIRRLMELPEDTHLFPGHGREFSVKQYKDYI